MNCRLSKTEINTFAGQVICLKLLSDDDITHADINWETDSDILRIRSFSGEGEFDFNDGILISLDRAGEANVSVTLDGVRYECRVTVREPRKARPDEELHFYVGDFHDHSSWDHTQKGFPRREKGFPIDIIRSVREDGRLDFVVLSDHGSLMQNTDLFRTFYDADRTEGEDLIVFPGSESECIACHTDAFGLPQRESGEFVLINAADYIFTDNFSEVNNVLGRNPYAIASIAHPNTWTSKYGGGCMITPRLFGADMIPEWKRAVKLFEMGNGSDRGTTILFEPTYSLALDLGYRVSPVCPSDCHGLPHEATWGFDAWPGKTVIMAPDKTKEYFLDALMHNRVYGTENGNTALFYTVNEGRCGDTLALTDTYRFHVEIGDIDLGNPKKTVRCEVISDYGKRVRSIEGVNFSSFDFTIESDTARYFYLRVIDENGLKTWSAPVWTGRAFDTEQDVKVLSPLDTAGFHVTSSSGADASILLSGNPSEIWRSEQTSDTIMVDMKAVREFSAVRLHAATYNLSEFRRTKAPDTPLIAEYPAEYRLAVSADGTNYAVVSEGLVRIFGLGYTIPLGKSSARYVRLELLTTVGRYSCRPTHAAAKLSLGEIEILKGDSYDRNITPMR